jgi:hypothetical protein
MITAVVAFAALVTVTQVSSAADRRRGGGGGNRAAANAAAAACQNQNAAQANAAAGNAAAGNAAAGNAAAGKAAAGNAAAGNAAAGNAAAAGQANQAAAAGQNRRNTRMGPRGVPDGGAGEVAPAQQNGRQVNNVPGDGQAAGNAVAQAAACAQGRGRNKNNANANANAANANADAANADAAAQAAAAAKAGNQGFLGNNCDNSKLTAHDGFQNGNRCVSTAFGEVAAANNNPSLIIARAPSQVKAGQAFTIDVSTQNLIRDRFLAAAQGGYYKESAFLANGLTRGHFHTACRILQSAANAPEPDPVPAFFVATEDGGGSGNPDTVSVNVTGLNPAGMYQCASWAGDGSHRIPMMERANQTPAFDTVRVQVQ